MAEALGSCSDSGRRCRCGVDWNAEALCPRLNFSFIGTSFPVSMIVYLYSALSVPRQRRGRQTAFVPFDMLVAFVPVPQSLMDFAR